MGRATTTRAFREEGAPARVRSRRSLPVDPSRSQPLAASGRRVDHRKAANASRGRRSGAPKKLVHGSATKQIGPFEIRAVLAETPIVLVRRQDQQHGRHGARTPSPSSSGIPRAALDNANLPIELSDIANLGLHLDDQQDSFGRIEGEDIGEAAPASAADIDLGRHIEAHASEATSDVGHAAGMRAVALGYGRGRQSDETHLHPRIEAIENLKGQAKRQVRDLRPLESRDVALADVDHPSKALLWPAADATR